MGSSIYVYDGVEDYKIVYPVGTDDLAEIPIDAMVLHPKGVIVVSGTYKGAANARPDFSKSLSLYTGSFEDFEKNYWNDECEYVTLLDFNFKKNDVIFEGVELEHSFHVGKYYGKGIKKKIGSKVRINGYMLFDYERNRLNFIINA